MSVITLRFLRRQNKESAGSSLKYMKVTVYCSIHGVLPNVNSSTTGIIRIIIIGCLSLQIYVYIVIRCTHTRTHARAPTHTPWLIVKGKWTTLILIDSKIPYARSEWCIGWLVGWLSGEISNPDRIPVVSMRSC